MQSLVKSVRWSNLDEEDVDKQSSSSNRNYSALQMDKADALLRESRITHA